MNRDMKPEHAHAGGRVAARTACAVCIVVLALVLAGGAPCFGQAFTANITGLVTDATGAVIPGATVTATNTATNEKRTAKTSAEGRYTLPQLLPGPYELTAEAAGFKKFVQQGITLGGNQSVEVSVSLQVGMATESVEVSSAAPLLDTQTADQSTRIETNTMVNLPISMRTPFAMVWANAGISEAFDIRNSGGDQNYDRFGMNGGRTESSAVLVDGVSATTGSQWNGLYYSPTLEAVQEVQLVRNSYDAEYGKSGGGVFSIVTKGGSSEFHGGVFDYLRNSKLDANSFFNNKNKAAKPFFARNQFGGNLGGPLWKSKRLFFFGSYQGLREGSPASRTSTVPTALQRQGDFSQTFNKDGSMVVIYDPFTTQPDATGKLFRTPFAGNRIPQSRFDSVGSKIAALYPQANRPGDPIVNSNNWYGTGKGVNRDDRYDLRIDWARSEKHTMYFRWSQAWQNGQNLSFTEWGIADNAVSYPAPRGSATFGNTFIVSPTLVVNVLFGHGNWTESTVPLIHASPTQVGLPTNQVAQFHATNIMPAFNVGGFSTLGVGNNGELHHPERTETAQVNVTKELGDHSLKFGYAMEFGYMNGAGDGGWLRAPTFSFDNALTGGTPGVPGNTTSGNGYASLLLGTGSGGSVPRPAPEAEAHHYYAVYAQDNWRLSKRLTLNLGLRWDIQKPTTDRYDRYSTFMFNAPSPITIPGMNLLGAVQYVNSGGLGRGSWDTDLHDLAPRVSLAYKVTEKLAFRAGYGIYYVPLLGSGAFPGFSTSTPWISTQNQTGIYPQNLISNPFPDGFIQATGKSLGAATNLGQGVTSFPRNHPNGYTQNYSADFQYQLTQSVVLQVGYSGNQSRKLSWAFQNIPANQLSPQYLSLGTALNDQVPNPFYKNPLMGGSTLTGPTVARWRLLLPRPQYTGVNMDISTPGGSAGYNALVVSFNKRFSHGLNLIANYQFSKAIDNTSEGQSWEVGDGSAFRNFYDGSLERSISAHDIPHSLAVTGLYELPVGKGKAFGANMPPVANVILGGWQVAGMMRFQTGIPVGTSAPGVGANFSKNYPNIPNGADSLKIDNRNVAQWFNTSALVKPAPFVIGSAPRRIGTLRQDGVHSADMSINKNFVAREPLRLQFAAQFFNLTNTPQFSAPNTNTGDPNNIGKVTGTWIGPRNIQLGLKLTF